MELTLEALGLSKEKLQELVIARAADRLLRWEVLEDGVTEPPVDSKLANRLEKFIAKRIDEKVAELVDKHVLPNVAAHIETLTLTETNRWGEKVGKPMTFIEYLVARADAYMREEVDYEGKAKDERDSFSSTRGTQTRIAHMIHRHLHYSIESAMKEALANANSSIVAGLAETVKLKLNEISNKLKVQVTTK